MSSSSDSSSSSNPNPSHPDEEGNSSRIRGGNATPPPPISTPINHQTEGPTANSPGCSSRERPISPQLPVGIQGSSFAFPPNTTLSHDSLPPRPPTSDGKSSKALYPSSTGYGFFYETLPVSVGGVQGDVAQVGVLRKRTREVGPSAPPPPVVEEARGHICSVCGKEYATMKALFGHMRSHPDRGWRGAHPPPRFRVEEEFADIINRPEAITTSAQIIVSAAQVAVQQVNVTGAGAEQEAHRDVQTLAMTSTGEQLEPEKHGQDQNETAANRFHGYRLPDLNSSPPSDEDE